MRDSMLLIGLLMSAKVVASETVFEEIPISKSTYKEMPENNSLQVSLERELAEEKERAKNLYLRSAELSIKFREVLLFDEQDEIRKILTSPDHPFKINMVQLSQTQLRIHSLEEQLEAIQFQEEQILFYTIKFSFTKPNPHRWGMTAPLCVDPPFNVEQL